MLVTYTKKTVSVHLRDLLNVWCCPVTVLVLSCKCMSLACTMARLDTTCKAVQNTDIQFTDMQECTGNEAATSTSSASLAETL